MHDRESIYFGSNFRNEDFDGLTRFEGPLNSKITFLAVGLSVTSVFPNQITGETSNLVFCIYIICGWHLKLFMEVGQKFCVQGRTKEF